MTLFAETEIKPKHEHWSIPLEPVRHNVVFGPEGRGTGENPAQREKRIRAENWQRFKGQVADAIHARLGLLQGRQWGEVLKCPWSRLQPCTTSCRCEGTGTVTVGLLLEHYQRMLKDLGEAMPEKHRLRRGRPQQYYP